jgi:hypothetical protein
MSLQSVQEHLDYLWKSGMISNQDYQEQSQEIADAIERAAATVKKEVSNG